MNKKFTILFSLITLLFGVSCSSDSDSILDTPEHEQDAALYNITSSNSPYSSIELTVTGNYIIIDKNYSTYSQSKKKIIKSQNAVTRGGEDDIIYGNYTKSGENTYNLVGFGTITVVNKGGNSVDLDIKTNSGNSITVSANRANINSSSDMTNKLCCKWEFEKFHQTNWENGKKVWEYSASINDLLNDKNIPNKDIPKEVIFTKAGTYLISSYGGRYEIYTWKWENESKGTICYSELNNPEYVEIVTVEFKGNNCTFTSTETEEDEIMYIEWIAKEIR